LYPYFFLSLTLYLSLLVLLTPSFVLLRDNDEPKKDAAAAPLLAVVAISKELPREEAVVTKSLIVPSTKGTPTRASKRLKKIVVVGTSLESHHPAVLSKNVSIVLLS
jgi:hypothetical protein